MKKITTILLSYLLIGFYSHNSQAIENEYIPYIGTSYNYSDTNNKGGNSYNNSVTVNLGSIYNKYFGTELFYQYSDKHKFGASSTIKNSRFQSYGLDIMGYLPLGKKEDIAPTLTMGIGEYTFKQDYNQGKDLKDHGWGYRFGGGLTYSVNNNLALRCIFRYIKLDGMKNIDHINEYTFGIRYSL